MSPGNICQRSVKENIFYWRKKQKLSPLKITTYLLKCSGINIGINALSILNQPGEIKIIHLAFHFMHSLLPTAEIMKDITEK